MYSLYLYLQNGPVLPDETNLHITNSAMESLSTTPSHVFQSIPTLVKEQTAKNESESDYKKFETTSDVNPADSSKKQDSISLPDAPQESSTMPQESSNTPQESSNTPQEYPNTPEGVSNPDGSISQHPSSENNEEGEQPAGTAGMSSALNLLRGNRLNENQRRELIQRILKKQGPDYSGDKWTVKLDIAESF